MLSTDVGAAPAAASARLHGNSAASGPGARRHQNASGAGDAFGEMFDRIADDRPVADGPGRRVAAKAPRGGQKPAASATAAVPADDDDTTGPVPMKPRHRSGRPDGEPSNTDRPDDATDDGIAVDPRLMALIPTIPVSARPAGQTGEGPAVGTGSPVMQPLTPKPFVVPAGSAPDGPGLPQTGVVSPGTSDETATLMVPETEGAPGAFSSVADRDGANEDPVAVLQEASAELAASADGGELNARPPAATEAVQANGSQQTGITARQVALSALHAALARESASADHADDASAVGDADPVRTAQAASAPEASIVVQPGEVPPGVQPALSAAPATGVPGLGRAADRASKGAGVPDAPVSDAQPPSAGDAPSGTASAGELSVAEAATNSASKQSSRSGENPRPTAPAVAAVKGQDNGTTSTTTGMPVRKGASHDPVDGPAPRPSARVAHAIAAFQAAATVNGTGTPASFRARVAEAASAGSTLLDRELPAQFVQAIRVQFDNGGGEARVRLNPGFLGGVTVGVQVDGTSVVASLQAGSADVREWLQRNEQSLRQSLADQGLHLERLVIVDDEAQSSSDDDRRNGRREEQQEQSPRRPRRADEQGTFELVL